jgi:beta-glucanase (GH16 family)
MLGDYPGGTFGAGWPVCGEIDVLEYFGVNGQAQSTVHTGLWLAGTDWLSANLTNVLHPHASANIPVIDSNWHVYRLEWTTTGLSFLQDGKQYQFLPQNALWGWSFNNPGKKLYQMLNFGIGGDGGGSASPAVLNHAELYVDYVRVWAI